VAGKVSCRGRRVVFESQKEKYPDGREVVVDRVIFPDSVAVLPFYSDTCEVVLIEQYRPSVKSFLLEAPAGTILGGESPADAALRELAEEAGLKPSRLERVALGYVSPGYSTELMHLFIAWDPEPARAAPEDYELIVGARRVGLDRALEMVGEGRIKDLKTILLILALRNRVSPGCGRA
jgi:ADP-ribose pyrophosphatase